MKLKCHNESNSLYSYVRDYRGDVQPRKHAGKEWEPAHGLELYDFGARHLDPVLGRFTTPDPAAAKYPSISPYAYCAANPLRYSDPTGCEILISGLRYDIGMGYDGPDNFTSRTVDALNMVADFGGSKLLNDLIDSENVFDFLPTDSAASYTMAAGGSTSVHLSTTLGRDEYVRATAHESMHAAQFLHGQGGRYISNEVEAYAFANYITWISYRYENFIQFGGTSGDSSNDYYNSFNSLSNLYKTDNYNTFDVDFKTAVNLFKSQSFENNNGKYNNYLLYPPKHKGYIESILKKYVTERF